MAEILHTVHSMVRYLVLLAGLAAVVTAIIGWRRAAAGDDGPDRPALAAFVGLLDLQVLLGVVLLIVWPYYPMLIGHIVMMALAAVAAHGGSLMARRRGPERSGSSVRAVAAVLALVFIVGGIMAIQRPLL